MIDYLKNISNISAARTSVLLSSPIESNSLSVEISEQPSTTTSSVAVAEGTQQIGDNIQYLSPQKIKIRKYTLKKG